MKHEMALWHLLYIAYKSFILCGTIWTYSLFSLVARNSGIYKEWVSVLFTTDIS